MGNDQCAGTVLNELSEYKQRVAWPTTGINAQEPLNEALVFVLWAKEFGLFPWSSVTFFIYWCGFLWITMVTRLSLALIGLAASCKSLGADSYVHLFPYLCFIIKLCWLNSATILLFSWHPPLCIEDPCHPGIVQRANMADFEITLKLLSKRIFNFS